MKKFYECYHDFSNLPTALAKLPWSINCLLIDKIVDAEKREWYGIKCIDNGWSFVVLQHQIDSMLYERQADNSKKMTNFATMLAKSQNDIATSIMKDPYVFDLSGLSKDANEHDVEKMMVERVKAILLELGKGFSFVGNQYRISTEAKDFYIDLLFYHYILRCFVVVELKTKDFDPSYIGKLQFYVTAIDETLKRDEDNPTIGLLLCKNKDACTVDWSLKSSSAPIGVSSYEIKKYLPTEDEIKKLWR